MRFATLLCFGTALFALADAFVPSTSVFLRSPALRATTVMPLRTLRPAQRVRMATCGSETQSGEIGNVDVTKAKVKEDEVQTDGIITLTDAAKKQVNAIKASKGKDFVILRVGVTKGGCSGMSYVMEVEDEGKQTDKDSEIKFDGFSVVVDPASLLFVFGMSLDYDDALIGGGFKFNNPNADKTCGCGLSFG